MEGSGDVRFLRLLKNLINVQENECLRPTQEMRRRRQQTTPELASILDPDKSRPIDLGFLLQKSWRGTPFSAKKQNRHGHMKDFVAPQPQTGAWRHPGIGFEDTTN